MVELPGVGDWDGAWWRLYSTTRFWRYFLVLALIMGIARRLLDAYDVWWHSCLGNLLRILRGYRVAAGRSPEEGPVMLVRDTSRAGQMVGRVGASTTEVRQCPGQGS